MSFCPFMSNPKDITDTNSLFPCINSCELYTGKECSFKTIAKSQYTIAKKTTEKDDNS